MQRRLIPALALGCAAALTHTSSHAAVAHATPTQQSAAVVRQFALVQRMPDGTELVADVYRPSTGAKVPAILLRTPYMRTSAGYREQGQRWARLGYAFVVQDVRGRGDSGGTFDPLVNEGPDGDATITWLAAQPWCDGNVGTIGGSYSGWTQVLTAPLNNPHLRALIPIVTPPDPGGFWPMRRGGVSLGMLEWAMLVDGRTNRVVDGDAPEVLGAYGTLPLDQIDTKLGRQSVIWQMYLDHLEDPSYWRPRSYQQALSSARAPMLHVSGWYDGTLGGSLQNFAAMRTVKDASIRDGHYLVIGPWRHWVDEDSVAGRIEGVDFGAEARVDTGALYRDWFDHYLRGTRSATGDWPRVRLFELGSSRWVGGDEWPLVGTQFKAAYLHRDKHASTDGSLVWSAPTTRGNRDTYTYDPANPTPWIWSRNVDSGGPDDYRPIEARADVLSFTTAVAAQTLHVCGPVRVVLFASSSARDTDWVARLSLVREDGYSQRLTDGWVRARARNGEFRNDPLVPGRVERYDLDLWGTCVAVRPGERLRLSVMSGAFPVLTRNLNTGEPIGRETVPVVAQQSIYRDRSRASHVLLPIIERPTYIPTPALRN